ncbi:MAG: tyrosine-type recombinase/integrase [Eggerthellaceae bacterium]|nr:tyrosine-type recombinase/integrase [Eggerthellaceae bacterium]
MATVPNNKGSYFVRKSGACQVRIPTGWNDQKKKYDDYREEVANEAEAIALIIKINQFLYHGGDPNELEALRKGAPEEKAHEITVSEYIEDYCGLRAKQKKVVARTIETDRERLARIVPYIGDKPMKEVTTLDIDLITAAMRSSEEDNLNGYVYSGTTTLNTFNTINKLFARAVVHGVVDKNPCSNAEVPKADTEEKRSLTVEGARGVNTYIDEHPLTAHSVGVALGLNAGMRLSEMLAFTWGDYLETWLDINKSLMKEKQTVKPTKNEDSRRPPCPPFLAKLLNEWKAVQQAYFKAHGLKWSESVPVVSSRKGTHITQRNFTRWFDKARLSYPVPDDWSFHEFRHTYVSVMKRDAHIDGRTIREMSGHKSERAFLIYEHTNEEWMQEAARRFDMLCAPWSGESICMCCALWTKSPVSPSVGCCWAREDSIEVTSATSLCNSESFKPGVAGFPDDLAA